MAPENLDPVRIKPWHDTVMCKCGGPLTPDDPLAAPEGETIDLVTVLCAACGEKKTVTDPAEFARIYWSAGAYAGAREAGIL